LGEASGAVSQLKKPFLLQRVPIRSLHRMIDMEVRRQLEFTGKVQVVLGKICIRRQ
jgi:hypothetical protein